jgi:ribosome-binding protein aMBF1 (putative translation factor)
MTKKRGKKKAATSDAVAILHQMVGRNAKAWAMLREEREKAAVAAEIHKARTARGLSQKQLAKLIGTTQSVIARLEDADYRGHSLSMLRRIAHALGCEVKVQLIPVQDRAA